MFDWLRKRSWKSSPTTTRLLPAYFKIGEYEKGIADCNKALDLRPDHANTYNNRGHCRAALGDAHGASADFQTALHLAQATCAKRLKELWAGWKHSLEICQNSLEMPIASTENLLES